MEEDPIQPDNRDEEREFKPESKAESMERRNPEIERKISLEEFQPKGTLTITLLYFVIIVLMWIFMYFVEFAGHGPSIMN
ncbi:MAG: hypothetical protein R3224_08845 [Balneolaceae bacterium]|nr:hypothetical protein [Balneolaceae bacterium]